MQLVNVEESFRTLKGDLANGLQTLSHRQAVGGDDFVSNLAAAFTGDAAEMCADFGINPK